MVVLVVKIAIQLMVFVALKRRSKLAYSMAMPEPQESAENKYLRHRMFFLNSKINAVIEEKL